jgi:hypothetical protein
MAMYMSITKLESNSDVSARKITMQRMSDGKKTINVKMSTLCSNISQQMGHFIASNSVVGFNDPYWDWVSKYGYVTSHTSSFPSSKTF